MAERTLDKKTIAFWRDAAQSEHFEAGLTFLSRTHAPKANRQDKPETQLHDSLTGTGYNEALDHVREILTQFAPEAPPSPSIPSLEINP